jgi:hypothetical protein
MLKLLTVHLRFVLPVAASAALLSCSVGEVERREVYTLYSTNHPTDVGRSAVATFEFGNSPGMSQLMCQEAADLYLKDLRERNSPNMLAPSMRFWCEKGRFKP